MVKTADKIIKNAKIFTADKDKPTACALAIKDGKFVYVGDEAGLSDYEWEVVDFGGKFIRRRYQRMGQRRQNGTNVCSG